MDMTQIKSHAELAFHTSGTLLFLTCCIHLLDDLVKKWRGV